VLKALRKNNLSVVAIHNHMTGTNPAIYFLHYWGKGHAATLATGFKAALDQTGKQQRSQAQSSPIRPIVFVCEHGAAKSVIAAAHFNRLATEQGLPWWAVSRGISPDAVIPGNIRSGLATDGLDVSDWKPKKAGQQDIAGGERVITLACDLPTAVSVPGMHLENWNVPDVNESYPVARTAILQRVQELLQSLADSRAQ